MPCNQEASPSSTVYLHKLLSAGNYLGLQLSTDTSLKIIPDAELNEYLSKHNLDAHAPQKCVLVGQAINITLLFTIIQRYLSDVTHVLITRHFLDGEFAQLALQLSLYHDDSSPHQQDLITPQVLLKLAKEFYVDAFKVSQVCLSKPGLLVMDMDSTIIDMECIDEIAALAGVGEKVSALTERAMQGELDFNQSLLARVSCLQGIDVSELEKLKSRLPINPGFARTISTLQKHGWVTCIASGGFTYFANYIQDTFELSHAMSNTLSIEQNKLTGKVQGDIVNGEMKKQVLVDTLRLHNIAPEQSVAIGDGANDLLMMAQAELGVAYKAKPKVQTAADANIHYCGFEGLLYCLQA